MRRVLLVALLVLALSLGIVAVAGAATLQGANTGGFTIQPAVSSAAAWAASQSADSGVYYAPSYDGHHCDHSSDSTQDSGNSY